MLAFIKNNYKVVIALLIFGSAYQVTRIFLLIKPVRIVRENAFFNYIYFFAILICSILMIFFLLCDLITVYIKNGNVGSKSDHIGGGDS